MADHRIFVENGKYPNTYYFHVGHGYHYTFLRQSSSTLYFKCQHYYCQGRAVFKIGNPFQVTQPHNHAPDILRNQVLAARAAIMNQVRSMTYMSFAEIVRSEKLRIPDMNVRSQLTLRNLRSAMQRTRAGVYPRIPGNLMDLTMILEDPVWECLTRTLDLHDRIYLGTAIGTDFSVNIVFMSSRCLDLLRQCQIVFADGTFFITPAVEGCYQVFTLVTIHGHTVIPLCWCLMQTKSEPAYVSLLTLIRDQLMNWQFDHVVCDFEDAMINAFRNVFGIVAQGCLFHSADAMARHAKSSIGLMLIQYFQEVEIIVRLCCSLPLLPANYLQRGMNAIGGAAMNLGPYLYGILRPYLSYVQHEWLDHGNRGENISVCNSEHRTNNASETNNKRMRRKFGVHHPNTYNFVRNVALFESESMDDLASLQRGLIPTRHRSAESVSNDRFISRITNELLNDPNPSEQTLVNFLLAASISIQGLVSDALGRKGIGSVVHTTFANEVIYAYCACYLISLFLFEVHLQSLADFVNIFYHVVVPC